jgi:transposase
VRERGYVAHIRRIGEEKLDEACQKRHPARRWVVERTLAWLSKCRGILVRYEKKAENSTWGWSRWLASSSVVPSPAPTLPFEIVSKLAF